MCPSIHSYSASDTLLLSFILFPLYLLCIVAVPVLLSLILILFPCLVHVEVQRQFLVNNPWESGKWEAEEHALFPSPCFVTTLVYVPAAPEQESTAFGKNTLWMCWILNGWVLLEVFLKKHRLLRRGVFTY